MRLFKTSSWLVPIFMLVAVVVDVKLIHLPVMSLVALWMCAIGGMRRWTAGHRISAIMFFMFASGWGYAGHVAGQLATAETALCRSVAAAVHCYTKNVGKAPRRLDDLVPTYLSELPRLRSPLIQKLSYRRASDTEWCVSWRNGAICNRQFGDKDCSALSNSQEASIQNP
jgi:hypothetical protein